MSDPDKAEQDKSFLARWSQRKQEAKQPEPKQDTPAVPPEPVAEVAAEPEFDLDSLPKLAELTETTDITAFLQKGVPEHLRNAALRKSWALDPAIRDYVSPALEYAYDWNTPGGVPGNGEIGAGIDVARMVSQIMGGASPAEALDPAGDSVVETVRVAEPSASEPDAVQKSPQDLPTQSPIREEGQNSSERDNIPAAHDSPSVATSPVAPQQPVRRHGSAKPIV